MAERLRLEVATPTLAVSPPLTSATSRRSCSAKAVTVATPRSGSSTPGSAGSAIVSTGSVAPGQPCWRHTASARSSTYGTHPIWPSLNASFSVG